MIIASESRNSRTAALQSPRVTSQLTCTRCGDLMVSEGLIDLWSVASKLDGGARRCVQCGDVIDGVILRNRRIGLVSNSLPSTGTPVSGIEPQVAA
jgi:hypothetical protein